MEQFNDTDIEAAEVKLSEVLMYKRFVEEISFPEDDSLLCEKVKLEVVHFLKEKIKLLMGVGVKKTSLDSNEFSPEEIQALKTLSARIIDHSKKSNEEVEEETEDSVAEVAKKQPTAAKKIKKTPAKQETKPVKKQPKMIIPNDQDIIDENGVKLKVKLSQIDPDSCVGSDGVAVKALKEGDSVVLSDGALIGCKNSLYFKISKFPLAVRSSLSNQELSSIMERQAMTAGAVGNDFLQGFLTNMSSSSRGGGNIQGPLGGMDRDL